MPTYKHINSTKNKQEFILTDGLSIHDNNHYYYMVEININDGKDTLIIERLNDINDVDMSNWYETGEYTSPLSVAFAFLNRKL